MAAFQNRRAPVFVSQRLNRKKLVQIGKSRSFIIFTNNFFSTFLFKIGSDDEEGEKESDKEIDIEFDEITQNVDNSCFEDGKMLFVYPSSEMKHIFNTYGNQLVLLDATYKTTKYALPLFFLVVKTNVNFQACAVFVIQQESTDMILEALNTVKKWNPKVTPKHAFVDFDEREITALESVYPNVKVFLCDFHREQAWNRWVNKADNGVANVADQIKVYLRSIAHSTTHDDAQLTVRNLMNIDFFNGKVKNRFTKTWLPNIRRWCLAYRPDDLILCNTNNGTERLNEDLKYDDLDGYKNCSLSELLTVIIESFIPKHYSKYVALNIRYGDGCKKYAPGVPEFLRNRPKQVVDMLLDKMYRVTDDIVVRSLGNETFIVESFEEGTRIRKEYRTYLGNSDQFCSCTCYNFRRYRMLCKHFFAIFHSGKATFYNLTGLFLDHSYMILDRRLWQLINRSKKGERRQRNF